MNIKNDREEQSTNSNDGAENWSMESQDEEPVVIKNISQSTSVKSSMSKGFVMCLIAVGVVVIAGAVIFAIVISSKNASDITKDQYGKAGTAGQQIDQANAQADISNAETLATAITAALSDEEVYNYLEAKSNGGLYATDTKSMQGGSDVFSAEVINNIGTPPTVSSGSQAGQAMYVYVNIASNSVEIYAGNEKNAALQLYPNVGSEFE